ncbi:kinase-like domain-containing protein [Xylaria bambusicola]|uniref:kinase-like domain-containing protein n=1 Tax=Xylaria bambusicola TaxID=326684 RepID=UPI0020082916|nr:kinase-like domain-containing protein [Xylaria bambusicola]KAI0517532.1 kinase-like domain-containing protein [Xylaria bambusicola]
MTRHIAAHLKSLALLSIRNIGDNTLSTGSSDSNRATIDSLDNMVKRQGEAPDNLLLPQAGDKNPPYVESAIDHQDFLPLDSFQSLITAESVQRVIKSLTEDNSIIQTLVEFVIMKAKKVFAILAVTGMEIIPALESLQQYEFTDAHLPITRDIDLHNCKINNVDRECNHPPAFNAFHSSPWDMVMLRTFYNEQWKFLAPVFSHDRRTQNLQLKCILPFIEPPFSHEPRKSSFFSDVYQVQIHPSHRSTQFPMNRNNTLLAIKELRPTSEMPDGFGPVNLFEREVLILEKLADFDHDHLVTLSGSFSRGDRHYILFPWANGGNLREFWVKDPRPLNREFMLEVLKQLTGLMHALCLMHNGGFRHGDLKPENILIFPEDGRQGRIGTLKISDMGQAQCHQYQTSRRSQPTQTRIGTMTYEAPEAVVSINTPRSRLYDVWSMGCIFFEFIVWLLEGPAGLEEVARDTRNGTGQATFFSIKPGNEGGLQADLQADLHSAVRRRLENFLQHEAWTVDTSLGDLIRVVSNQMLVIALPQGGSFDRGSASVASSLPAEPGAGLSASPEASLIFTLTPASSSSLPNAYIKQRADACTIMETLKRICGKSEEDGTYLLPSPKQ